MQQQQQRQKPAPEGGSPVSGVSDGTPAGGMPKPSAPAPAAATPAAPAVSSVPEPEPAPTHGCHADDDARAAEPSPATLLTIKALTLLSLNDVVLHLVLSYLDSDSMATCHAVCRLLGSAAQSDDLWQAKCLEDWGEKRRVRPDQRSLSSELAPTYLDAWRAWRRDFNGYHAVDVKRVAVWWAGIEAWMSQRLPEVLGTLNTGVTEEQLDRAEEMLGWPLPTHLRLMYRFHNGQWLPWDERLNDSVGVDEGRPAVLPEVVGSGTSLGLLGGCCFYHHMTTSKLFSLQRGVLSSLATTESFAGENQGYFEACAVRWGTDLEQVRLQGGFLLAAGHQMKKRAWVGRDGNVRFDGKAAPLMGVFDAAPVASSPPGTPDNAGGGGGGGGGDGVGPAERRKPRLIGGNLMAWLEEYLRRLESGQFGVRAKWLERVLSSAGNGVPRVRKVRGVWIFPREGGEGCVTDVTKGVEIQVSPAFIPEECADRTDLMWAYTVRMKLLGDHPSRPPAMSSCQLSTRHWEIDGPEGFHREVSGDGVIGDYPLLSVEAPVAGNVHGIAPGNVPENVPEDVDQRVFEYESCTNLERTPGTMGGYFSFTPGSLDAPSGAPFDARVPTFDLVDPTFIF